MTTAHPRWGEFLALLAGPEACNLQGSGETFTFRCAGGRDKTFARAILRQMGFGRFAVARSVRWFEAHGGFCDCEILWNCDPPRLPERLESSTRRS